MLTMASVVKLVSACLVLLSVSIPSARTAYKGSTCPAPCQCYEFLGVQSTYCNNTGITSVPQGIPEDTQLLDLSRNPIPFIKVGAINNLPNLQYIVLSSNGYREGSIEYGALDLPKLTDIYLVGNAYTTIPKSLPEKMTSLIMDDNKITVLKANSFNGYPNLQNLNLEFNGLLKIEDGAFAPLSALQQLSIRFNNLTDSGVPAHLFSKNLNLTQLEMRFNNFEHVLPNLPPSIQYVDYVGNKITTLQAFAFSSTPNLQSFEAWDGQINFGIMALAVLVLTLCTVQAAYKGGTCPSPCRCLHFEGLQSVYCNSTSIRTVPPGIPTDTQLLELSDNNIPYIAISDLKGLNNLQELYLSANGLMENSIETGALDLPNLTTIEMSYNLFKTIPKCLPKNISKLWFYNNQVSVLKSDSFINYTDLQYLDVSNNYMTSIEKGVFDPLFYLQTLYIAFNNLTDNSIPLGAFSKAANLQLLSARFNSLQHMFNFMPTTLLHLDYVGNQIKTIPAYAFKDLPNLQTLSFWEGQVTTIEDNAFYGLKQLRIMDMNEDKISSVITNNTFSGLTGLQTFYLYSNNIRKIEGGAFQFFGSLSELWLQDNKLSTLDPEVLNVRYIPNLSELYIDTNPWYCDCHLRWLREKVGNASYVIQDPHLITCAGPEKVAGKAWDVLQPSDFVCS